VVVIGGVVIMAVATLPGLLPRMPLLLASRLVVGVGEAAMMAAAVLWLLRLAGPTHRGRALGHIGLANYAGLAVGPPLAQLVGAGQPARVLVLAASLPLLAAALAATLRSRRDVSARAATDQGGQVTEQFDCGSQASRTSAGSARNSATRTRGRPGQRHLKWRWAEAVPHPAAVVTGSSAQTLLPFSVGLTPHARLMDATRNRP
jgi:MFS family permease